MARTPGLRGRLPQKQGDARFAIRWAHEYMTALPTATYPIDVTRGITDWGMFGNGPDPTLTQPPAGVDPERGVGDCVPAAVAHERMLAGAEPTANQVVALYWQYDKQTDQGVNIADFLLWCYQEELIHGFMPVEPSTVDAIMSHFDRGIIMGVNLTDDAEDRFTNGLPWTVAEGEVPDPEEGHGILRVKVESAGGDRTAVTWAADQAFTAAWDAACTSEYWLVVTDEDTSSIDYAGLQADLHALPHITIGPDGPVPVPQPPAPTPPPAPAPQPAPDPAPPAPAPGPDIHGFVNKVHEIVDDVKADMERGFARLDAAAEALIESVESK